MRAARGQWALEYAGHPGARMLDGGLKARLAEASVTSGEKFGLRISSSIRARKFSRRIRICSGISGVLTCKFSTFAADAEYFSERVRAKHGGAIPGAVHQDWSASIAADGTVNRPLICAQFEALGLDAAMNVPYCQGGLSRCARVPCAENCGLSESQEYLGSWAEWGNRDDLPREHPRRKQPNPNPFPSGKGNKKICRCRRF